MKVTDEKTLSKSLFV